MPYSGHLRTLAGEYLKVLRRFPQRRVAQNHVVFLAGVQRSGTNMVMEMLEQSADTKVFHENDTRVFDGTFCQQGDDVVRKMAVSVLPCVVFKALSESHKVSRLMSYFPHSSVIWVYRPYEPVIASNMAHWPGGRNDLGKIVIDRTAGDWRGSGMTDQTHEIVRQHYRPDLNVESAQALFWYYRNQLFFDQGFDRDPRALLVRYDSVAHSPVVELKRIADFLGIRMPGRAAGKVFSDSAKRKPTQNIDPEIRKLCDGMMVRLDAVLEAQMARR